MPKLWTKLIFAIALATLIVGFLLYVAIRSLAPIFLQFISALWVVLPPFIIALALAYLLDPFVSYLQKKGPSRFVASLLVFLAFVIIFGGAIVYLVPKFIMQIGDFTSDLPEYYDKGSAFLSELMAKFRPLLRRFQAPTTAAEAIDAFSGQIKVVAESAAKLLSVILREVMAKTVWLVLIVILTFILLKDLDRIRAKFIFLLPDSYRDRVLTGGRLVGNVFMRYLQGLVLVCFLYGLFSGVIFSIFGLRYSLLIGLAAGLLYAVPYIGSTATSLIVFLVSIAQRPDQIYLAVILVAISLALNQVFDMLLSPRILGGAVGLHPAFSILALMFGGAAFGVPGMVLAVPVAASIQVILCEAFPKLREPLSKFDVKAKAKTPRRARRKRRERSG